MTKVLPRVTPRLIIDGAAKAIELYGEVFGAKVLESFGDPALGGKVVHCALGIGDSIISVVDSDKKWCNLAPTDVGGSPVILSIEVEDALAVGKKLEEAGGEVLIPIEDRFYGKREGRMRDPFGHLWIISQHIEDLSDEEIQRRMAEYMGG